MSASLPGVSEPVLPGSSRSAAGAVHGGIAQHVARRQRGRQTGAGGVGHALPAAASGSPQSTGFGGKP